MKRVINVMYLAVSILVIGYGFGLLTGGSLLSLVLALWSLIKPLPSVFTEKMWLVYLVSGIPGCLYSVVYIIKSTVASGKLKQEQKGADAEENNG